LDENENERMIEFLDQNEIPIQSVTLAGQLTLTGQFVCPDHPKQNPHFLAGLMDLSSVIAADGDETTRYVSI